MEDPDAIQVLPEVEEVRVPNIVPARIVAPVRPATNWQKTRRIIYNPQKKAIFGRTCEDWGRLGLFYLVFYAILAAIFSISLKVLLLTMDTNAPKWKLEESLIGTNPGLGFRPFSLEDGACIQYNLKNLSTIEKWVNLLDTFLGPYQNYTDRDNFQNCTFKQKPKRNHVCMIDLAKFGPCQSHNKYGYNTSSPCVFIKLNRIFKWVPRFYKEDKGDMPRDLRLSIKKLPLRKRNQIWISCKGEDPVDRENVQGFQYYPSRGIPGYFYPYLNVKNYLSPLVAVRILNPKHNVLINIECRAWARNIYYRKSKDDRQGSMHFEILVHHN